MVASQTYLLLEICLLLRRTVGSSRDVSSAKMVKLFEPKVEFATGRWRAGCNAIYVIYAKIGW